MNGINKEQTPTSSIPHSSDSLRRHKSGHLIQSTSARPSDTVSAFEAPEHPLNLVPQSTNTNEHKQVTALQLQSQRLLPRNHASQTCFFLQENVQASVVKKSIFFQKNKKNQIFFN